MIIWKKEPDSAEALHNILHPVVRQWFFSRFKEFSLPQLYGVTEIHSRNNILVSAPTGSTKTLTGFLSILNELVDSSEKGILENRVYCIYISPLRALSYDIEKNLKEPLEEMEKIAGRPLDIRVAARTGDTTASERSKMLGKPPHILITTPESLAIMLTTIKFRELLKGVQWVIIDEIHALAENKRGTHLALSMERLQKLAHFTRVGLSATVSPLEEVAKFLVGYDNGVPRPCRIVDVQFIKDMDLKVLSPVPNLITASYDRMYNEMYALLDRLVQEHRTTLIFTNTRAATERVVHYLKERFPKNYTATGDNPEDDPKEIGAHHGSLSKRLRHGIETRLREGKVKCIVCSTSLELGIDIGYIDLVILLGSPKSVARALQRIGRSGHKYQASSLGRIVVLDRDDLVECSVLLKSANERKIDRIHIPKNCSDVLAQQIFGMAISDTWNRKELLETIRRAYPFHDYPDHDFREVIDYLAGKYISLEDRHVYAKIWHDEETDMIGRRGKLARILFMTNVGTIPDETAVQVKMGTQTIGMIDEAFLERLKRNDIFVLGGETYQFQFARGMVAQVIPAVGKKPTVPSWFSEMLPLSFDLAMEIGKFRRLMEQRMQDPKEDVLRFINDYLYVDSYGAEAIYNYLREQHMFAEISHDKKIIVENYSDEKKKYAVFHTLFGRRVNDCLSRALAYAVGRMQHIDVEIGINDNGFYLASHKQINVKKALSGLKPQDIRKILEQAIDSSEVLKRRFRHCATRALMILRNYKGHTKRVGRQQVSSMILLNAVKRISDDFPILKEARREVLEDLMDIENTEKVLKRIEGKDLEVREISTELPSPFAFNLIAQGFSDILKMEEKAEFLKRMHEMVSLKISLKEARSSGSDFSRRHFSVEDREALQDKAEMKDFSFEDMWAEMDKKKDKEKDEKKELLKQQLFQVKKVPGYAKMEILKMIEGDRYGIRPDVLKEIENHKEDIRKDWPQELSEFILQAAEECD
ncbi:ATP-dependent helicase [Candidatus Woesearchaeota archaeon]|nr:ATP-dependent helicase [Candidatus Woesearchaeota archaeon]